MYPVLKEGVYLGTFEYDDTNNTCYYIENAAGEEFEVSPNLWHALYNADGTKALNLPDGGKEILPFLKQHGIVSTSRFVRENGMLNRFILFNFASLKNQNLFRILNRILCVLSIIAVLLLMLLYNSSNTYYGDEINYGVYVAGVIISLSIHEIGHMVAGYAYGYNISDAGILLLGLFPIGAYIAHEEKKDAQKYERVQFAMAGIEMNLIVAVICLLIARMNTYLDYTMISIASVNLILIAFNLLPASSLDGEQVLSFLLEVPSISKLARKWLFNKKRLQKLVKSGFIGYISIGIFTICVLSQVILYFLLAFDIVIISQWILSLVT